MKTEIPNTIRDSVMKSFKLPEDKDEMQNFAEAVRVSWREQATAHNRSVFLMLAFVALFALLTATQQTQFAFLGFTFANTSLIQILIPPLVAYLYLDAVVTSCRWEYYENVHRSVMEKINPELFKTGLDRFMGPRSSSVSGAGVIPELWRTVPYGPETEMALAFMGLFALGAVPLAFQVLAYIRLIDKYGYNPLTWVSLALSTILMARSISLWAHYGKQHAQSIWSFTADKLRERRI
jgi:hypothetical protein